MRRVILTLDKIIFMLTIVILVVVSAFTLPRAFGIKPFVVLSGSMEPTIPTGSLVFVDTKYTDVQVDDIITFGLSTGKKSVMVTHRVNDIQDGMIQTKGDNNDEPDGWLDPEAVIGVVKLHIPWLGIVLDFLQKKGFVLIAIWVFAINGISKILTWFVTRGDRGEA